MKRLAITITTYAATLLTGCSKLEDYQEQQLNPAKQQTLYGMHYGSKNRQVMDVCLPAQRNANTPVVILIHGGAWIMGDKGYFYNEMKQFADEGIACATINYRYASDVGNVHHPDLPNDVKAAVEYVASKAALWNVSDSRFGLGGHSAGGHLALITSYAFNDGRIKACVSWCGPLDFTNADQLRITGSKEVFKTYLGRPLNSADDEAAYRDASPYWRVTSASVPTLLVHGTSDDGVPYSNAVLMHGKLDSLGVPNALHTFQNGEHIWTGNTLKEARKVTLQWFLQYL